tara:strand:+ start:1183 stop:1422 length:240 start_codon:yes stop_codon:yes gene_type:complete
MKHLIKLTFADATEQGVHTLWIDPSEIVIMERYEPPKSIIINPNQPKNARTALVFRMGKVIGVQETPEEIMKIMSKNYH